MVLDLVLNLLYHRIMKTVTISDIKRWGSKVLSSNGPLYLIVNSKPKSVILPLHEYESLVEAMEDLEDMIAIEESRDEPTVPLEEVFPDEA